MTSRDTAPFSPPSCNGSGVRRCRGYWLCGIGGWVLGLVTGLLGRHAIAASTESVIWLGMRL